MKNKKLAYSLTTSARLSNIVLYSVLNSVI